MTAIVFVGPTLPRDDVESSSGFRWHPPAAMGDVYRAALARPSMIGLIDGLFETTPSVWHKEILWAMSEGIHVYGSASMGALRAAELARFGMIGVGKIFEAYSSGALCDDDDVAVVHGPESFGYPPFSEAMVNIRATLERAGHEGLIEADLAARLAGIAKSLYYKQRSYRAVLDAASAEGVPKRQLRRLEAWLERGRVDQKRADAAEMLAMMRRHLQRGVEPLAVRYAFEPTVMWRKLQRWVQ